MILREVSQWNGDIYVPFQDLPDLISQFPMYRVLRTCILSCGVPRTVILWSGLTMYTK